MTDELILYDGQSDVQSLKSIDQSTKNHQRITFDFSSHKLLTQNNISHSILENYVSEDEKTVIDNFSVELTSNWHKLEIFKKCLEINDINIGFLLEFELLPYFLKIVKKSEGYPVRFGEESIRFEVRAGDGWGWDSKNDRERVELVICCVNKTI